MTDGGDRCNVALSMMGLKRGRFQNKDIVSSQELVNSEKNTGEGKQEGQENRKSRFSFLF